MKKIIMVIVIMILLIPIIASAEIMVVVAVFFDDMGEESPVITLQEYNALAWTRDSEEFRRLLHSGIEKKITIQTLSSEGWKIINIEPILFSKYSTYHRITLQK